MGIERIFLFVIKKSEQNKKEIQLHNITMKQKRITSIILLCSLLLISSVGFSQQNELKVLYDEKTFGKNLINGTDIIGTEYMFPERIHRFILDSTKNVLTIQLRELSKNGKKLSKTGNILQYDFKNKNILWSSGINFQIDNIQLFGNFIIKNGYSIDVNTGKNLWEVKHDIYLVDLKENIGIGYRSGTLKESKNILEGVDLRNGETIWKREINREYGWNSLFYINDSTLIVVASGIHEINIYNGKGWDYNAVTGKSDATGLLYFTGGLASNALLENDYIYFASKEQIVKLDKHSGNIEWKYPFRNNDLISNSSIFVDDKFIYMVNKGLVATAFSQFDFGRVFFAAFDKQTGEEKYLSLINSDNRPIKDFQLLDKDIYLLCQNKIVKCNIESGFQTLEKEFRKEKFGSIRYFTGNRVFVNNQNDDFYHLAQNDPKKLYCFTTQNKILILDNQLNVTNTIDYENAGIYFLRFLDYKFIAKKNQTFIVNKEGKKIAELNISSNAFIIGDILYEKRDKYFVFIDLKRFLTKQCVGTPKNLQF